MQEKDWFEAARNGDDEQLAKLLAEHPNLIAEFDDDDQTALYHAASGGHEKAVALLLATRPALVDAAGHCNKTALFIAAQNGHDKIVAQLLAAKPRPIRACDFYRGTTPFHFAAAAGFDEVVALLLVAFPDWITAEDYLSRTALNYAVIHDRAAAFNLLLPAELQAISETDKRVKRGREILHLVAQFGRDALIAQVLAVCPNSINLVDLDSTVLHSAIRGGHQSTVDTVLAIKPDLIFATSDFGTILHHSLAYFFSDVPFIAKLWRMNPQALQVANKANRTPFHLAVMMNKGGLIELFQWKLSIDEIASAFKQEEEDGNFHKRLRPVLARQCEALWTALGQDVVSIVFEYLGVDPIKRARTET